MPMKRRPLRSRRAVRVQQQYGVDQTKVLGVLREKRDAEEEGTILATFSQQGVQPEAVKAIYGWYTTLFNNAVGDARNLDAAVVESDFGALAKTHGVAEEVVDALVERHRRRL